VSAKSDPSTELNTPAIALQGIRSVHFVGIGGAGLSAMAAVLLARGFDVSGSDLQPNVLTQSLSERGARIFAGHAPENVRGADLVVVSSAVPESNPERAEAARRGIPVIKRGPLLAALISDKVGIAVAGSHGKTTTAGMIAFILSQAGLDPSFVIGGVLENFGANARAGDGPHFVLEADEYDRAFLALKPHVSVITNVEMDHPDCFRNETELRDAFRQFAAQTAGGGLILAYADDPEVALLARQAASQARSVAQTFGFSDSAWWRAADLRPSESGTAFTALRGSEPVINMHTPIPGEHNVLNALTALAVAAWLNIPTESAAASISAFRGVQRRLEVRGVIGGVTVLDDYAHHPTQIAATLGAVRQKYQPRALWAVFQPHTYSRLKALWRGFSLCFGQADHVLVLPVYPAREAHDPTVRPRELARQMAYTDAHYVEGYAQAASLLARRVGAGHVVITLGAGDEWKVGDALLAHLKQNLAQTLQVSQ
jgi:UDP-N-acetylmuramate--alanine ligase